MAQLARHEIFLCWRHRLSHWYGMFAGNSYYHQPQGLGRAFVPGCLRGYFNDLTAKTQWNGGTDAAGLPVSKLSNGKQTHLPVLLCQKALGHWDRHLLNEGHGHEDQFLKLAHWLADTQDQNGGWNSLGWLGRPHRYRYSAMTQGEAISVMARAHLVSEQPKFERACRNAVALLRRPVEEEGVCAYEDGDVFLEEFPGERRDTVLNGWVFALFGVYDYLLRFPDASVEAFYHRCCATLRGRLADFDTGYWSCYSSGTHRLASPFYHHLHLSQLEAVSRVLGPERVAPVLDRWAAYQTNRLYKSWAVFRKALQKLGEPAEVTVIG